MIIRDLHIQGIAVFETEAHAILIVDPDTPLTFPVTAQRLQAISRWDTEVLERMGVIQHL